MFSNWPITNSRFLANQSHNSSSSRRNSSVSHQATLRLLCSLQGLCFISIHFSSTTFSNILGHSLLPPAQWPQILGNTCISPIPGFMFATSIAESSGLPVYQRKASYSRIYDSRKVEVCLPWQNQCFCFDALHGLSKISIVRFLVRTVSSLPRVGHDQHILWVCYWGVSLVELWTAQFPQREVWFSSDDHLKQRVIRFSNWSNCYAGI